jgi:hypothetical protein
MNEPTVAILDLENFFLTNFKQTSAVCGNLGTKPYHGASISEYGSLYDILEPDCMKSVFEVGHLATFLNERLNDLEVTGIAMREPPRVMQNETRISL